MPEIDFLAYQGIRYKKTPTEVEAFINGSFESRKTQELGVRVY
jgi:hypothetical protein